MRPTSRLGLLTAVLAFVSLPAAIAATTRADGDARVLARHDDGPTQSEWLLEIDGEPWTLLLERRALRAPTFRWRGPGPAPVAAAHWVGVALAPGREGRVALSLDGEQLRALIRLEDAWITLLPDPTRGAGALRAIRDADGSLPPLDGRCGIDGHGDSVRPANTPPSDAGAAAAAGGGAPGALPTPAPERRGGGSGAPGAPLAAVTPLVIEVGVDADVEFLNQNGGSVAATLADIEMLLNAVELIYDPELNLHVVVTSAVVRTSEPDPYSSTDPFTLSNQVQAEWSGPLAGLPRDSAHLFTGKDLDGAVIGFANVSVACLPAFAVGLSQSRYTTTVPHRVALTAHELGHNLGASHCSGSDCHVMCPAIGGCSGKLDQFGNASTQQIAAYVAGATCLDPATGPLPLPFVETFPLATADGDRWPAAAGVAIEAVSGAPSAPFALELSGTGPSPSQQDWAESAPLLLGGPGPATLTWSVRGEGTAASDTVVIEATDASGGWLEIDRVTGPGPASFMERTTAIPAAVQVDGARLRLRSQGTAPGERFLVDDLRVGTSTPAPPVVTAVQPAQVASLLGGTITVTGAGFLGGGLGVSVGPNPIAAGSLTVVSDTTLTFPAPAAPALGPVPLIVSNAGGASTPATLTFVAADPPALSAPPLALNGQNLSFAYAGVPGELPYLMVSASGLAFSWQGQTILDTPLILPLGKLTGSGVATLSAPLSGIPAGTTIHMQVLTVDGPGQASTLAASSITQTFVFF